MIVNVCECLNVTVYENLRLGEAASEKHFDLAILC